MTGDHDDHGHGEHDHADVPDELALRVKALQTLLIEKGLVAQADIDRVVENFEQHIGPHLGAGVIAKAWTDPEFRELLLRDGIAAMDAAGVGGWRKGTRLVALENTPDVHNVVVCTLCSCYPIQILGLPPVWYKSTPYRSRVVIEPRSVLEEFGTRVGDNVEVRVWDSNSEVRYLVVPEQPAGTEHMSMEELAGLVTRNAMIGVEVIKTPAGEASR